MRRVAVALVALLVASCGSAGTSGPANTQSPAASTPAATPSTPTSAKGAITLKAPAVNAKVTSPVTISGDASVFEAALAWRITDTAGRVITDGFTTASLGAPGRGTYSVSAAYTVPAETVAFIEVFSRSAKDGSIDEIVRIPVTLR